MKIRTDREVDEFDEFSICDAYVHIERMSARSFWIGIEAANGQHIHVNTGIEDGEWFFRVEEVDAKGGISEVVERPACYKKHKAAKP